MSLLLAVIRIIARTGLLQLEDPPLGGNDFQNRF